MTTARVISARTLVLLLAVATVHAAQPTPEASAAFDRYVKVTEDAMNQHRGFEDFLWLDHHPDQKSLVWLGQSTITPQKTPEVPDGVIQHWLGAVYLEQATLEHARDVVLNFADYDNFFKQQVIDSKLIEREGEQFDFLLRLYKKQISSVLLNVKETAKYTLLDPTRVGVACRSTHIGEVAHPNNKKAYDDERAPADESGYLWRLNLYWRLYQADNGVYAEVEVISLAREPGGLSPGRILNGFQNFPRELTEGLIDGLHDTFPRRR